MKIKDPEGLYFVTFTVVHWIDLFIRKEYKDILIDSLKHCQENKGLVIHAFDIMTSHVHLIVSRKPDGEQLSGIIRDFKKYTSGKLLKAIKEMPESRREWLLRAFGGAGRANPNNSRYQVWIQGNHPVELVTKKFVRQKLDYVHHNPVKTGIVFSPHDSSIHRRVHMLERLRNALWPSNCLTYRFGNNSGGRSCGRNPDINLELRSTLA